MPSTGSPRRARAAMASARPERRSQARSATVLLVPGRITRSAPASSLGLLDEAQAHARLVLERVEVVEVGDARQADHGDVQLARARRAPPPPVVERQRVLVGDAQVAAGRARRPARAGRCARSGSPGPGSSSAASPRNLLTMKAAHPRALLGLEQLERADEGGEDAAPVDVADQQHRGVGGVGDVHVDDVAGAQVDLGRAAGALDHDQVVAAAQPVEAAGDQRAQLGLARGGTRRPTGCRSGGPAPPPASASRPPA